MCVMYALDVKLLLSWLNLLLCTNPTHHDYWHKGNSLKYGSYDCTAAAVLLVHGPPGSALVAVTVQQQQPRCKLSPL